MPIVSAQDLLINAITLDRPRCMRIALSTLTLAPAIFDNLPIEMSLIDPETMVAHDMQYVQIVCAAAAYHLNRFREFQWLRLDMQMLADRINYSRVRALGLLTDMSDGQDFFFSWMYGRKEVVCAWTIEKRNGEDVIVRRSSDVVANEPGSNPLRFMTRMEWRPQFPFSGNFFEPLE